MEPLELPVKAINPKAILPKRAHDWDAGLDLYSIESRVLFYGNVVGIRTGIQVAIPQGFFGLIAIRSSLGKKKIQLANAPGIIDAGYRGEIIVMLTIYDDNLKFHQNFNYHRIHAGERVAQMIVLPNPLVKPFFVDNLPTSDGRNAGGFGSSGTL